MLGWVFVVIVIATVMNTLVVCLMRAELKRVQERSAQIEAHVRRLAGDRADERTDEQPHGD